MKVSFAKEPYNRDDILQKSTVILRSLLIVATHYPSRASNSLEVKIRFAEMEKCVRESEARLSQFVKSAVTRALRRHLEKAFCTFRWVVSLSSGLLRCTLRRIQQCRLRWFCVWWVCGCARAHALKHVHTRTHTHFLFLFLFILHFLALSLSRFLALSFSRSLVLSFSLSISPPLPLSLALSFSRSLRPLSRTHTRPHASQKSAQDLQVRH